MDPIVYPTFQVVHDRGIIPCIYLPENFRDLAKKFYEQGRKEDVESYKGELEKLLSIREEPMDIKLLWCEQNGLTNIGIGVHGGLDIETRRPPSFREHNLGWTNGFIAASIAMKYISELLKSE